MSFVCNGSKIYGSNNIKNSAISNSIIQNTEMGSTLLDSTLVTSKIDSTSITDFTVSSSIINKSHINLKSNVIRSTIMESNFRTTNSTNSFISSSGGFSSDILDSSVAHSVITRARIEDNSKLRESAISNGLHLVNSRLIRSNTNGTVDDSGDINTRSVLLNSDLTCSLYPAVRNTSFLNLNNKDCSWIEFPVPTLNCVDYNLSCDNINVKKGLEDLYPNSAPGWHGE